MDLCEPYSLEWGKSVWFPSHFEGLRKTLPAHVSDIVVPAATKQTAHIFIREKRKTLKQQSIFVYPNLRSLIEEKKSSKFNV